VAERGFGDRLEELNGGVERGFGDRLEELNGGVERGFGDRSNELNGRLTVFRDPLGVGGVDLVDRHPMDRRQIIGVMIANRLLHLAIVFPSGLEQQSEFGLLLDLAIPNVKALNLGNLDTGNQAATQEISGHPMGDLAIVDRSGDSNGIHGF
jgi:hypothetical protein